MKEVTRWYSPAIYRGEPLMLSDGDSAILTCEHDVAPMHHEDDWGRHSCPTGFVICRNCGATGDEPTPHACERWE